MSKTDSSINKPTNPSHGKQTRCYRCYEQKEPLIEWSQGWKHFWLCLDCEKETIEFIHSFKTKEVTIH